MNHFKRRTIMLSKVISAAITGALIGAAEALAKRWRTK